MKKNVKASVVMGTTVATGTVIPVDGGFSAYSGV